MNIGPVRPLPPANLIELYRQRVQEQETARINRVQRDSVSLSDEARLMSRLETLPAVRQDRVEKVKAQLAAGTYDVEGRLDAAVDRMIDELPLSDLADRIQQPRFV